MQFFRAAELGPAHFGLMQSVCAAELKGIHEAAALGDLKRNWKQGFRAAEPGTAHFEQGTCGGCTGSVLRSSGLSMSIMAFQ